MSKKGENVLLAGGVCCCLLYAAVVVCFMCCRHAYHSPRFGHHQKGGDCW